MMRDNSVARKPYLSICIASYNRPKELRRCLDSIDTSDPEKVEVVVCDDASPKREEIRIQIEEFVSTASMVCHPFFNEENLGFDRNLANLIVKANGEYVLVMSDDDALLPGALDATIAALVKTKPAFALTAYRSNDALALNRQYDSDFDIPPGIGSVEKYLYDSILFSGLIYKRDLAQQFSASRFVNFNYFQIYLSSTLIYRYGGNYFKILLVDCIADGENGYGTTELSERDPLLADRGSVFSNLRFNEGLVKAVKLFDEDNGTDVISWFEREYSLRSYRGLSKARRKGRTTFKEYWEMLHDLGINIRWPAGMYYVMLTVLGADVSDALVDVARKALFARRKKT